MNAAIITFTDNGRDLSDRLISRIPALDGAKTCHAHDNKDRQALREFVKQNFVQDGLIVFIGAAGIAVRLIAPFVKDKTTDPAVLVLDEKGKYVIPVLSGHIGRANELSGKIAAVIDAVPVITTATDINDKFSVDIFAKENGLELPSRADIVEISAKVLEGAGVRIRNRAEEDSVYITIDDAEYRLLRKPYVLGIGCRKGIRKSQLEGYVNAVLTDHRLSLSDIGLVTTIDIKKEEKGLLDWCRSNKKKLLTFSAAELMRQKGDFSGSDFVKKNTGTDNVCERAVVAAGCRLVAKKMTGSGITVAIGIRERKEG